MKSSSYHDESLSTMPTGVLLRESAYYYFPTISVKGLTKIKGNGMKLNLIVEPTSNSSLPNRVHYALTCCNLEPGSSRISVGLRNLST